MVRSSPRSSSHDEGFQMVLKYLWGTTTGRAMSLMRMPF